MTNKHLHTIITESIHKILNEGKTVNHVPMFRKGEYEYPHQFNKHPSEILTQQYYDHLVNKDNERDFWDTVDSDADKNYSRNFRKNHNVDPLDDDLYDDYYLLNYHKHKRSNMIRSLSQKVLLKKLFQDFQKQRILNQEMSPEDPNDNYDFYTKGNVIIYCSFEFDNRHTYGLKFNINPDTNEIVSLVGTYSEKEITNRGRVQDGYVRIWLTKDSTICQLIQTKLNKRMLDNTISNALRRNWVME